MRDGNLPKQKSIVRVRTGCGTCKIRKVKCDEAKPECKRCVSTGRKCDGYPVSASKSDAHQTTSFYSIPFRVPGSQHDRQMLHYYCNNAANDLSAYPIGSFEFWVTLVLQRAQDQPVLYNPLIALASIHLDHVKDEEKFPEKIPQPSPKTLDAYNRSVRQLRKYMTQQTGQDPIVLMICCILLSCFESGRGERSWALRHLQAALMMFKRHKGYELPEALVYTLRCLDIQTSVFDVGRIPVLPLPPDNDPTRAFEHVPTNFTSYASISLAVRTITQIVMQFLALCAPYRASKHEDWPEDLLEQSRTIRHRICEHRRAYSVYVNLYYKGSTGDAEEDFAMALFAIWHKVCGLILSMNWDVITAGCYVTWSEQFRQVLSELGSMFSYRWCGQSYISRKLCCQETAVVPLFLIITKCNRLDLRFNMAKMLRLKIAQHAELMGCVLNEGEGMVTSI